MVLKSDWLTLPSSDLKTAIQLALELRELVAVTERQRRHFLAGLGSLIGASVTMWLEVSGILTETPIITRVYDQGWSSDSARTNLDAYLSAQSEAADPAMPAMMHAVRVGEVVTRRREQLVDNSAWYGSVHVQEYRRAAGLDDCIYSSFLGRSGAQCLSLHRPWNHKRFSERERILVRALHAGCVTLLDSSDVTAVDTLSRRLRQALEGLVQGKSEKQIASELGVSPHTLHGYIKILYRRLGVSSRGELAARYGRVLLVERVSQS
jgi:DNA-binding NarL/FixJ family response regulator